MKRSLLTLLSLICIIAKVSAETYVVDVAGGGDFTRIHDAVSAATDGDTILVNSGTHYFSTQDGAVTVDKELVIQGYGYDLPEAGGTMIQSNQAIFTFTSDAEGSKLRGLRLSGTGSMVSVAASEMIIEQNLFMSSGSGAYNLVISSTLRDTVRNNIFCPGLTGNSGGIDAQSNTDLLINNNIFAGLGTTVLYLVYNTNDKIVNNVFAANLTNVIHNGLNGWNMNYTQIYGNILYRNTGTAVYNAGGTPTVLYNCFNGNNNDGTIGSDVITQDPAFVDFGSSDSYDNESFDSDNYDFHLGNGSPCIDSGHLLVDYNDSDGSRNDMGVYGWIWPIGTTGAPTIPVVNSISVSPTTVSPSGTITIQATGRIGE